MSAVHGSDDFMRLDPLSFNNCWDYWLISSPDTVVVKNRYNLPVIKNS